MYDVCVTSCVQGVVTLHTVISIGQPSLHSTESLE